MNIAFVGGGNMATALIAGLLKSRPGQVTIRVADPSESARKRLVTEYGVDARSDSRAAIADADVIVLAVKPQVMPAVLCELADAIEDGQLVLSIAAGTTIASIQEKIGHNRPVVRSMPNTPALIGHGVCGLFASGGCKPHHLDQADHIMRTAGDVVWVEDESLMDVITAVSGSGPAYFFLMTEALAAAGQELGLCKDDAQLLAIQTAYGAGAMLEQSGETPASLREKVTSPGGTTQAAIETLEANGFRDLIHAAVQAATRRGRELAG